jgi:hypothetical protein
MHLVVAEENADFLDGRRARSSATTSSLPR